MALAICVVGLHRGVGKTQVVEYLVREFSKRGVRVATVKHLAEGLDLSGKDTWRHLNAGALEVIGVSPKELVSIRRGDVSIDETISSFHENPDLILIEGFRRSDKPKILCAENLKEVKLAFQTIENIIAVTGRVAEDEHIKETLRRLYPKTPIVELKDLPRIIEDLLTRELLRSLPRLNCGRCGYASCEAFAEAVSRGRARIRSCVVLTEPVSKIELDGVQVPLSRWPQRLLKELILGFLRSLKLGDIRLEEVRNVRIDIDLRKK